MKLPTVRGLAWQAGLPAAVFLGFLTLLVIPGHIQFLELLARDLFMQAAPVTLSDKRITVLGETERDLPRFGHPLPDRFFAELIERLMQMEAAVIGVDKLRDIPVPPGSRELEQALEKHQNVIWIHEFGDGGFDSVAPPGVLENTAQTGFNDLAEDADGVIRRGYLILNKGDRRSWAFSLLLANQYLYSRHGISMGTDPAHPGQLKLGNTLLPPLSATDGGYQKFDDQGYQILLDFPGAPEPLSTFTLSEFIDGQVPAEAIKDKVVIIGGRARSLKDLKEIPVSLKDQPGTRYGVDVHAYITRQLIRLGLGESRPVRFLTENQETAWILLWYLLGLLLGRMAGSYKKMIAGFVTGTGLLIATAYFAALAGWWLIFTTPLLAWFIALGMTVTHVAVQEKAQKKTLMSLFAKHVSPSVADLIWEERENLMEGGRIRPQTLTATVLFSDIRGFTTISEEMSPTTLMDWLNDYMDVMSKVVLEHGGIIDNYLGDGLMAVFGVPLPRTSEDGIRVDAVNAVRCALEMNHALAGLNEKWRELDLPVIGIRVGIHTGSMVSGSIGGSNRMDYTIIGDTVNTAARLESYGKEVADTKGDEVPIVISESTYGYVQDDFEIKDIGTAHLKGKAAEVGTFRVVGERQGTV